MRVIIEHLHHIQLLDKIVSLLLSGGGLQRLDRHGGGGVGLGAVNIESLALPDLAETSLT